MERSFPKASGCALQCKEILTWQQDAGTNSLHVPPDGQSRPMPQSEQQNTETNSLHVPPDARSLLAPQSDVDGGPTEKHRQEEEHKAQHKSAQKKLKQAKETKVLMYVVSFVIPPSINATTVAPDPQVLERAK